MGPIIEFFNTIKPCTSMIEVKGLIDPEYLIEIEATAFVDELEDECE